MIGYDIRVSAEHLRAYWPHEEQREYLLRPEIDMPLSVDTVGWPTIFDYSGCRDFSVELKTRYGLKCLPHPADALIWTGWWLDKAQLDHYIDHEQIRGSTFQIGVSSADQLETFDAYAPSRGYPDPSWSFKGYDVASQFMDHGLTSGGLAARGYPDIIVDYPSSLNENGLFANKRWAEKLRWRLEEIFNEAFFVYGLHIIREL